MRAFAHSAVALAMGTVVGTLGAAPAHSADGIGCKVTVHVSLTPGLSVPPSSGTFTSTEPAPVSCSGQINGHRVTCSGTFVENGRYGTSGPWTCQDEGDGDGQFTIVVPTEAGPQTVTRKYTLRFALLTPPGHLAGGTFSGTDFAGDYSAIPTDGDCIVRPVTAADSTDEWKFN